MAGPFETQIGIGLKDNFSEKYRQLRADIKRDDEEAQRSRERLGIQSRQQINQNIQELRRAYQQLASSSVVGANEQVRAYEKVTREIAKLDAELGKVDRTQSRLATGMQRLKSLSGIAAGLTGAAMVLAKPIQQQRDFDTKLHSASNFLYRNDNDAATRLAGVQTIRDNINKATEYGGGTRDAALDAAEVMGRSKMGLGDVFSALPEVMKVSTATGANASDVASLMTSTFNFGFSGPQANAALDAATTASQHGKADVALLSREAPRGLENAKSAGFAGPKGFADVLALYEVAASVAGTADEGATNANDLLSELSSVNLANSAARVKINGKKLDYKSMAVKDAQRGHNSLYTLERMVQGVDRSDPQMKALRRKMSAATDPADRENLQRAIDERHGQNIGLFLHNQQSKNAFMGYERNPEQFESTSQDIQKQFTLKPGERSTDVDYAVMKDTAAYKEQKLKNQNEKASDAVTKPLSDALGNLEGKVADLAVEFPKVATAAEGAAIALSAVAAFGALKGGMDILTRLKKGGVSPGGVAGEVAEVAEDAAGSDAPGLVRRMVKRLVGIGGAAGKKVVSGGKSLVKNGILEDGLMDNPFLMTIAGLVYPSDTVSGTDESNELARLKAENQHRNRLPTSGEALNMLQGHSSQRTPAGGQPVIQLPAQPAPPVNINLYVDGHQMNSWLNAQIEQNARRHGA